MTKPLKTWGEIIGCTQIANLALSDAGQGSTPTPTPPCPTPRPRAARPGGHPPRLTPIPMAPTPFRELAVAFGFGVSRELETAAHGVGGVCYGA